MWNLVSMANSAYQQRRVRARIVVPDQAEPVRIRLAQLGRIAIVAEEGDWALRISFEGSADPASLPTRRLLPALEATALLRGDPALQAAAKLLPAMNAAGAKRTEVDDAVRMIGEVAEPANLFARYAARPIEPSRRRTSFTGESGHVIANLPKEVRLALEMATHEESERRALEGELSLLHAAWREAEEIAAIADDMFVPEETRVRLSKLKRGDAAD